MFGSCNFVFAVLTFYLINDGGAYKMPYGTPMPVQKNSPYVYRGQVFILRETDDSKSPFVAEIVNGGIEMVLQGSKSLTTPPMYGIHTNDSLPDVQEDPEYFAVLVTPETAALVQISRSMIIEVPLVMLLTGITKRMPWVMVLKRKNHFDYFRNTEPTLTPMQIVPPLRRRSRSMGRRTARLVTDLHRYDMLYSQEEKFMLEDICSNVIQELAFLNSLLHQYSNDTVLFSEEPYDFIDEIKEAKPINQNETAKVEYPSPIAAGNTIEKYLVKLSHNKTQHHTEFN